MIHITKAFLARDGDAAPQDIRWTADGRWATNGHWLIREDHIAPAPGWLTRLKVSVQSWESIQAILDVLDEPQVTKYPLGAEIIEVQRYEHKVGAILVPVPGWHLDPGPSRIAVAANIWKVFGRLPGVAVSRSAIHPHGWGFVHARDAAGSVYAVCSTIEWDYDACQEAVVRSLSDLSGISTT